MRQYIGAIIAERNILSPLFVFDKTPPINFAVAIGNGTIGLNMFKLQITLDRHNLGLNLNSSVLLKPPHFSLPSTFLYL